MCPIRLCVGALTLVEPALGCNLFPFVLVSNGGSEFRAGRTNITVGGGLRWADSSINFFASSGSQPTVVSGELDDLGAWANFRSAILLSIQFIRKMDLKVGRPDCMTKCLRTRKNVYEVSRKQQAGKDGKKKGDRTWSTQLGAQITLLFVCFFFRGLR